MATTDSPSITLALQPPRTITATYSSGQTAEVFTVHEDEKKNLYQDHNNQVISLDQATEIVLAKFFFGEAVGG